MSRLNQLLVAGSVAGGLTLAAILAGGGTPTAVPTPDPTVFGSYTPVTGCLEELPAAADAQGPQVAPVMPEGAYLSHRYEPDPAPGIVAVIYTVPISLDDFIDFVLARWPEDGWTLGRGERERGEAESVFFRPDRSRYGQFRARSVYCDLDAVEVTLTLGQQAPSSPAPKGS